MPLKVSDGIKTWIDDFKNSDNPQFNGKSAEKRRDMAIAAYMSAKNESVQEAKRTVTIDRPDSLVSMRVSKDKPPFDPDPPKPQAKNSDGSTTSPMSRAKQLAKKARDRQKDENYVSHAQRKAVWASRNDKKNEGVEENNNAPQTAAHRRAMMVGVNRSNKVKLKGFGPDGAKGNMGNPSARAALKVKESVELEEAHAYSKAAKALHDYGTKHGGIDKADFHTAAKHVDRVGRAPMLQKSLALQKMNQHFRGLDTDVRDRIHMTLRQHGVMEAVQVDELSKATHDRYQKAAFSNAAKGMAKKRMGTMSPKDAYDNEVKRYAGIDRSKYLSRKMKEENLDELKKSTYAKYINKASAQAVGHSDEAGYQSGKHEYDGDPDRETAAAHLAGKAEKRLAGIKRATKALSKEGTVQELKKSTLGSYVKKASQDAAAKAYGAASAAKDNRVDQSGKDFSKSMKRLRGIDTATKKLASESTLVDIDHTDPDFRSLLKKHKVKYKVTGKGPNAGYDTVKLHGHPDAIKKVKKTMNYESVEEAKSFDQKFKDHLKFSTSKSPAVKAYLKKRAADRDAMNKKNDPNAAKKGYALSATPPERAYMKARKHGMSTGQARDALSQKAIQKKKMSGKLPG